MKSAEFILKLGDEPVATTPVNFFESIAAKIPLLGNMCEDKAAIIESKKEPSADRFLSTNYLLDNYSKMSHFISYLILAFSILYHYRKRKINYFIVFGLCFLGGGLLELVQEFFIVGRSASLEDQYLNCEGALLGMLLFWSISKTPFSKYLE